MIRRKKIFNQILTLSIFLVCAIALFFFTNSKSENIVEQTNSNVILASEERVPLTVQSTSLDPNLYQALYSLYEKENGVKPEGLTNLSFTEITELSLTDINIESISGINAFYFDNLETLNLSGNSIKTVNTTYFSRMPKLKTLYLNDQKEDVLTTIDFSINPNGSRDDYKLPNLKYLDISGNLIDEINLEACLPTSDANTGLHTLIANNNQLSSVDVSCVINSSNGATFIDLSNNLFTNSNDIILPRPQNLTSNLTILLLGNAISNPPSSTDKITLILGLQAELVNEIIDEENQEESQEDGLIFEVNSSLTFGKFNKENFAIQVTKFKSNGEENNVISTSYILESDLTDNYSNILPILGIGEFKLSFGTYENSTFTQLSEVSYEAGLNNVNIPLSTYEITVLPELPSANLLYKNQTYTSNFPKISSPATLNFTSPNPNAELYYSTDMGNTWIKGNSFQITEGGATFVYVKAVVGDYESNILKTNVSGAINLYLSNGALFVIILAVTLVFFVVGLPLAARFLKKR